MSDFQTPEDRKEAFQKAQLERRLKHADTSRAENFKRQEEREQRRADEREKSREHSRAMYADRRSDKIADDNARLVIDAKSQKEITRREILLREIGARLYKRQLEDNFEHDVRTRDLDHQEYRLHAEVDTENSVRIDNNASLNTRLEIREHLRSLLIEKIASHAMSESAKRSAAEQELARLEAESLHRTTEIIEESAANEREMRTEYELKKDFELFMRDLRRDTDAMSFEDMADIMREMKSLE